MDDIWVVIPACNEQRALGAVIDSARKKFKNIVVVDDCSADSTFQIACSREVHVCRHAINLGQGAALQTGIDYALRNGAKAIVTFDADGQHSIDDAIGMVHKLFESELDAVLGSRFLGATEGMKKSREMLLRLATWYTRMETGLEVTDTHNGLRVLSRHAAETIRIRHNRMAHASEILNEIATHKLHYEEAPCTITYSDYSVAKGQKLSGAFAILYDLFLGRLYK